jgi:hypothetical protein
MKLMEKYTVTVDIESFSTDILQGQCELHIGVYESDSKIEAKDLSSIKSN